MKFFPIALFPACIKKPIKISKLSGLKIIITNWYENCKSSNIFTVIENQVVRDEARFMPEDLILILDADKNITWTLKTLLESENYPVIVVDTIDRAIKDFSKIQVAGFISEYRIENDCTLETICELKRMCPETYVMMVTDKDMKEVEYEKAIEAGVDDFFLKPMPIKKILLHLRKGLRYRGLLIEKARIEREMAALHPGRGGENISKTKDTLPIVSGVNNPASTSLGEQNGYAK